MDYASYALCSVEACNLVKQLNYLEQLSQITQFVQLILLS